MLFITDSQFSSHTSKHTQTQSHPRRKGCCLPREIRGSALQSPLNPPTQTDNWDDKEVMLFSSNGFGNYFDWTMRVLFRFLFFCPFLSFEHNVQLQLVLLLLDRHFNDCESDFFLSFLVKCTSKPLSCALLLCLTHTAARTVLTHAYSYI